MPGIPLYAVNVKTTFDPTTLSLTGYWRANYANSPWSGTASAGTSGSNSLSSATAPTTGTAQNGFTPASFNGTTQFLTAGGTLDTYANSTVFSGWCVGKVPSPVSTNRPIFCTDDLVCHVRLFSADTTLRFSVNNATAATKVFTTDVYQLFTWRYDGVNIQVGVNEAPGASGGASSAAYTTAMSALTGTTRIGYNSTGAIYYTQLILEVGVSDLALTDANFASIKTYVNSRYGLSL